ncbi:Veg family protein [Lactobacillus sp. ESL0684]|uniref:Veg family protein n=1 Tax=unclassified Lactobacillus TaxID=2620435 RepID=UPI0023F729B3|nr:MULTISPECIES: Veg family protein [unclassified Lactobacillus]WEV39542.1 Veg family protein [Lactobacillus sp. ESL0681]WEV43942.1 Veg family protein [Lactobacillus sp. ESL0684]
MPTSIITIKQELDSHLGDPITVVARAGRKKITKRRGVLRETFPAVFVVDLDQDQNNFEHVSYSYTDLLTKNISLKFDDGAKATE